MHRVKVMNMHQGMEFPVILSGKFIVIFGKN